MPEIAAFFSQTLSVLSTIFMIWMLIDCIRNRTLVNKGLWVFFILFTQVIGATVYFFVRGPWSKVKPYLFSSRFSQVFSTPRTPFNQQAEPKYAPAQEIFPDYARGYQASQPDAPPAFQQNTQMSEPSLSLEDKYEQPLITYPEMPSMQQHE